MTTSPVPAGDAENPLEVHGQLATINQSPVAIEREDVRGAGGAIVPGHPLSRVVQVGKRIAGPLNLLSHYVEASPSLLLMAITAIDRAW